MAMLQLVGANGDRSESSNANTIAAVLATGGSVIIDNKLASVTYLGSDITNPANVQLNGVALATWISGVQVPVVNPVTVTPTAQVTDPVPNVIVPAYPMLTSGGNFQDNHAEVQTNPATAVSTSAKAPTTKPINPKELAMVAGIGLLIIAILVVFLRK